MKTKNFMKIASVCLLLGNVTLSNAQVTIGSGSIPRATLDVIAPNSSTPAGIIAPNVTLERLTTDIHGAAQTGAIVYVTNVAGDTSPQTVNVDAAGYYYFDGTVWQKMGNGGGTTKTAAEFNFESGWTVGEKDFTIADNQAVFSIELTRNGNLIENWNETLPAVIATVVKAENRPSADTPVTVVIQRGGTSVRADAVIRQNGELGLKNIGHNVGTFINKGHIRNGDRVIISGIYIVTQ
jgi:hypothetical protein